MNTIQIVILAVVLIMSFVGFFSMGIDKKKAIAGAYRTKEKTLFFIALLFGAVGSTIGMFFFRHKTKHWYFRFGFPIIAVINIVLTYYLVTLVA